MIMHTHIKKLLLLLPVLYYSNAMLAQDFTFSQFYQQPLLRNPSLAGVFDGDIRISGGFRNQWQSVTVPFKTGVLSAEYKIPVADWNDWVTLGMQAVYDEAGDIKLKRTQILPVINYHKSLSGNTDDYLSLAFMAGPVNSQFDPTRMKTDEQFVNGSYSPSNPTGQNLERTGFTYWDASTGITFSSGFGESSRYYAGIGLFHFNKPTVAFYTGNSNVKLQQKLAFNAGLVAATSESNTLSIFADYFIQGGNKEFFGGFLYGTELSRNYDNDLNCSIYLGCSYRWNDALVPTVKMDWYSWAIGISYDVNVSRLRTASTSRGGLELTGSYKLKLSHRSHDAEQVRCVR
jgi:type IX secretion system PorP/SprF family membrane protein